MYKPAYVWPNPAFPFRVYFNSDNIRIFIIENLQHNYEWLSMYKSKIKENDYFFVILGSHWSEFLAKNASDMFEYLSLNRNQFYVFFNDERDQSLMRRYGFYGDILNQNAWLDYDNGMNIMSGVDKIYDSIYVGRLIKVKRHFLASNVSNLALVTGVLYGNNVEEQAPSHIYRNQNPLSADDVCLKINQSRCGLILSEREGACFASSEYLLSGIPVVSTKSEGGRDYWYDDYNSIVCNPCANEVAEAVQFFLENPRDPETIRCRHINLSNSIRYKFISILSDLIRKHDVFGVDPSKYFFDNYFHKMRKSYKPNFQEIFDESR